MSLSTPPTNVPRLFVGGLSSTIETTSLLDLLKPFGKPSHIERHSSLSFAHLSLQPHDTTSIDKCIALLNNTEWNGAKLKILRAREHYMLRLRREWEQENADQDTTDEKEKEEVWEVKFRWNGRHNRFTFCEHALDHDEPIVEMNKSLTQMHEKPAVPISATLASTMQLFGLDRSAETTAQIDEPINEVTRVKRRKTIIGAAPVTEDAPVDLGKEKETALSVLAGMFSKTDRSIVKEYKRLGLYRKLQAVRALSNGPAQSENEKQTKGPCAKAKPRPPDAQAMPNVTAKMLRSHTRAGLYRKLMPQM